ncbi:MAG: hypothetical protein ABIF77_15195 [bacterium]
MTQPAPAQFLQVLVDEFEIHPGGNGAHLYLEFSRDTQTLRSREEKNKLLEAILQDAGAIQKQQNRLDHILRHPPRGGSHFSNVMFPYRYASGGALPILRRAGQDYCVLFYRDIFPVGWNIANGGSESWRELLDPGRIIERELREELLFWDPHRRQRYLLAPPAGQRSPMEYTFACRLWHETLAGERFLDLAAQQLSPQWILGPDTLTVSIAPSQKSRAAAPETASHDLPGCFLNITAQDIGIEVDRIIRFELDDTVCLTDGEINSGQLVDRPIGLFRLDRLERNLASGANEFLPDLLFHGGRPADPDRFRQLLTDNFLPALEQKGLRLPGEFGAYQLLADKFDLCPVTRSLLRRYLLPED